ncbi:MAG: DUF3301 domain-containing protein [Aliivibrio sp.]|uniref:DUF3301 domain-containing protein n=1 Tax=Aliivibrio sp. TaxID=1872443 RepID=UPI001A3F379D|nr:DUF3301 domain-containing protein [Aliivibrio sp.]
MDNLLAILLFSFIGYGFWQQHRQSELANLAIKHRCKQLNLQLLNVSRGGYKLHLPDGKKSFHTLYLFEFSAIGDDCYQGKLIMKGFRAAHFTLPPHRMPDE